MPESTDFKGLFDTDISIQEAQTANTASVSRWTQFRQDFTALKPDAAAFEATREGQKALNESYKANITQFVDNFSSARLSQMNTQELMTVYTGLRDINAFDDMARLYNNSADAGFKNAPVVREFLAVSYNKTGRPADAIKVAEGLVEAGHANGEVYGALGKAYQLQRQAADGLADAMDSGDASRLARAETTYRSALNLPEGQSLPNSSALRNQAQSIVESSRSAYHKGFTNTFDFYPGINAAYGDLAAGDYASAVKTAELTHLAALRDGGLQTTDYWRTSTMLESSIISGGDEASIKRALATLVSYKDVPEWQWRSTTEALNDRVKPALEKVIAAGDGQSAEQARQALHHIEDVTKTLEKRIADPSFRVISGPVAFNDAANPMTRLVQEKSFSYRGMSTWDAQMVNGNMRFGGAIADHMVTQRDRAEFAKLLDQPVDDLMRKLGGNPAELPQAARGKTLNQIDDVNTFLETSQKITRANFSTETRGLEVIDGVSHHTQFDAPVEGINRLAGVPDNPGALRNFDSRTSLSAEFGKGLGDCRHHAQAQQLMFDEWQRGKMNQALFAAHNAQTAETRAAAIGRFENLRNTELRTFDVEVYAPIKIEDAYKPIRPDVGIEGRMAGETFIASKDMARVEDHTMNMLVRYDKTGNVESARFADAFYQNTYKWGNGEVDIVNVKNIDGSLALSAGKLEGVAGANGNAVDVLIKPTPYAGNRRALAHGDVGAVWERGTPYGQYDLVQAIEQRPVANSNIAKATTELPKLKLSGDDVHKQLVTMLDGKDLPATARRPDMRLIVRNSGAEDIQFKNPGGHAAALERIPPNEAAMVMLKGNTLEAQQLNAAKLDKLYSLSEKGISPQFLDDLKSGNLSDYIAEAYGPAPLEAQAKRLETTRWVNADGTNIDINPVKGENAAYGVRPASKEQVFMVKLDGDAPATLQGTGTSAERFYKGADGNNYIAVAVAKDGATGEIRTRPIAPDVAKQYYGDGFKDIPVLEMDKTGKVSSIDTAPHIKTVSQNAELKAASIAESKPKLYSASELDFGGGKPVISSAQKFILPVPDLKGNGEPLVYPAGHEKAGQSITDWQGKKIGDDGIVFFNHADKSVQAVPSDSKGVIIMNQVTEDQARLLNAKIESMGGPEKLSRSQIKEVLEYAQKDLGLGDMYNSDVNFIKSKMSPIGGTGKAEYGLHIRDDRDIVRAVFIEGKGEFQGPAATPQKFDNGAVIVKQGDNVRLVQPDIFEQTYRNADGSTLRAIEIPKSSSLSQTVDAAGSKAIKNAEPIADSVKKIETGGVAANAAKSGEINGNIIAKPADVIAETAKKADIATDAVKQAETVAHIAKSADVVGEAAHGTALVAKEARIAEEVAHSAKRIHGGVITNVVIGAGVGVVAYALGSDLKESGKISFQTAVPYGETALKIAEGDTKGAIHATMTETAGIGGAIGGAVAGAAIGSVVPIVGTTIGAVAGGIIGGVGAGMGTDVLLTKVPKITDTMKKGVDATMTYVSGTASTVKQTASRAYDAAADAAQSARQYTSSTYESLKGKYMSWFNKSSGADSQPASSLTAEQAYKNLPAKSMANMPPEVQALIEVKGSQQKFREQFEELKKQGSLAEVEKYMKSHPVAENTIATAAANRHQTERQVSVNLAAPGAG